MRKIINISLPGKLNQEVEKAVKSGNYATKSEFFRDLLRLWKEEQLLQELRESQREVASGKAKKLRTLKHLR
ncbi:MAG: type II toxin-antitoxin system ParD family antitoxin [Candidatus Colwellbacteria bacterium]|nr:type II toxin-antitoxin system ParD family antitoxin [Candidatus Colwellbacteria bacterium]